MQKTGVFYKDTKNAFKILRFLSGDVNWKGRQNLPGSPEELMISTILLTCAGKNLIGLPIFS
jgi:hypothetical protein